jgi:hypothetical protein
MNPQRNLSEFNYSNNKNCKSINIKVKKKWDFNTSPRSPKSAKNSWRSKHKFYEEPLLPIDGPKLLPLY